MAQAGNKANSTVDTETVVHAHDATAESRAKEGAQASSLAQCYTQE